MSTQHIKITVYGTFTVAYLRSMQEKIKTNNRIPIEQVEKIIRVSTKYVKAMCCNLTLTQMWQKLKSIKSPVKEQS